MKRTLIISGLIVTLAIIALVVFNRLTSKKSTEHLYAEVKKGTFEITVAAAGELIPENSIDIKGPDFSQTSNDDHGGGGGNQGRGGGGGHGSEMRMMDLKIQDIVPEGTIVKKGDYVAQLDRTSYDNTLKDEYTNLQTLQQNLDMKILDTAVTLTSLRDQIKNQVYAVEDAQITLEQSKYEPPATIHMCEVNLDKAKRALEQLRKTYKLRTAQTLTEINTTKLALEKRQKLVTDIQTYLSKFTITAPADGMVTYKKDRGGSKRKTGSSVNPFDMVIATLPDLSSMISKIYVSEIEVARVEIGQKVNIVIDALPSKAFKGNVISIANIGETLPNSDAKMFETQIMIDGSDPELRPAMTTGNKIIIKTVDNAVFVPTECIQTGPDSIPFVYLRNRSKHVLLLGDSNDKNTIVEKGLDPGISVCITTPENPEKFSITNKDLIPEIKERMKAHSVENNQYRTTIAR
jgi:multidrug efflux pump subunit AcrA (membrane-fusion protein)